jgi:hypothetical protein
MEARSSIPTKERAVLQSLLESPRPPCLFLMISGFSALSEILNPAVNPQYLFGWQKAVLIVCQSVPWTVGGAQCLTRDGIKQLLLIDYQQERQ